MQFLFYFFICVALIILSIHIWYARPCKGFARDIGLVMYEAVFGNLPKGKYPEYRVYTKHFSREELCVLLDPETLNRMDACVHVATRDMSCRLMSYAIDKVKHVATLTLAVTLRFEGELADGQKVIVHIMNEQLIASLAIDPTYYWKLEKLTPVLPQQTA